MMHHKTLLISIYPHVSGPFTQYLNLKKGLVKHNWKVIGISLKEEDKENEIYHLNNFKGKQEFESEFLNFVDKHKVSVFIPIYDKEFREVIPLISQKVKIIKRASTLTYSSVFENLSYCSAIVATTPRQKSDLTNLGVDSKFIYQIPNPTIFKNSSGKEKVRKYDLGYLGRVSHPRKGVLFIPQIFKKVRKVHKNLSLVYYGSGQDSTALKLMHTVDIFSGRKVKFFGHFSPERVGDLVSNFKIFVMPSSSEGFGIALIEAMAGGAVPVATRIEGVTDYIIDDGKNGFVVERNRQAFVEKINFLLNNPEELEKMKLNAMKSVKDRFDLGIVANFYSELLNNVVNSSVVIGAIEKYPLEFLDKQENLLKYKSRKRKWIPNILKDFMKVYYVCKTKF